MRDRDDLIGLEAKWTFGLSWLSIIYSEMENAWADAHLLYAIHARNPGGKMPELYYAHTSVPNENTPLGWSEALLLIALKKTF